MTSAWNNDDSDFVSLIKFEGRPILPPVMTPSIRNEMRAYRQTAIDLENKRNEKRRLHILQEIKNVTEKVKALNTVSDEDQTAKNSSHHSIQDSINSTISDRNIYTKTPTSNIQSVPSTDNPQLRSGAINKINKQENFENCGAISGRPPALYQNFNLLPKPIDTIVFTRPSSTSFDAATDISALSAASTYLEKYMHFSPESVAQSSNVAVTDEQLFCELEQSRESLSSVATQLPVSEQNGKGESETPRRHVRRSSYTLEAPSPVLLAAMRKVDAQNENQVPDPSTDHVPSGKQQHLENFLQNVSSVPVAWQDPNKCEEDVTIATTLYNDQEKIFENLRQELDAVRKKGLQDALETQTRAEDDPIIVHHCDNDTIMKHRYDKLSAAVKGYLVRRLMKTERVQSIIKTIQDTLNFAIHFHAENIISSGNLTPEDVTLHQRLLSQISGACYELHDIFNLPPADRMAIIAQDREIIKAKADQSQPLVRRLSAATVKAIERRRSKSSASYITKNSQSPGKRKVARNNSRSRELRGVMRPNSAPVPQKAVGRYLSEDAHCDKPARSVRRSLYGTNYAQTNK